MKLLKAVVRELKGKSLEKMQAHRRAVGFSIVSFLLKIGSIFLRYIEISAKKAKNLQGVAKKNDKQQNPYIFIIPVFFQTGPYNSQK